MSPAPTDARPWVLLTLALNVGLLIAAGLVYLGTGSQLVLAQGADSLLDLGAGAILAYTAAVGSRPEDENHPFGHERAEPIGALVTAIFAGVLAFEILRRAVTALAGGEHAALDGTVAAVLGGKFLIKAVLFAVLFKRTRASRSSALRATLVDTRNDVVATASSLIGYAVFQAGYPAADPLLAIPIALYIGYNGIDLARENLRYLMGEAPSEEVLASIREAAAVPGVIEVSNVRAQYVGPLLHVEVTALVRTSATATEAHDLALDVRTAVEKLELVSEAFVHVDTRAARDHT